jgi:hypothetical protein
MSYWTRKDGFTRKQQGLYRPLVAAAWQRHCKLDSSVLDYADKAAARRAWYEAELEVATGETTTSSLDPKRDFEAAMAHFEMLAGAGIYWNLRVYGGDARRIAHNIREVCIENDVDEVYMRGMARRSLRLTPADPLPELASLEYEQLITLMGELKRFLRRGGRPGGRRGYVHFPSHDREGKNGQSPSEVPF